MSFVGEKALKTSHLIFFLYCKERRIKAWTEISKLQKWQIWHITFQQYKEKNQVK